MVSTLQLQSLNSAPLLIDARSLYKVDLADDLSTVFITVVESELVIGLDTSFNVEDARFLSDPWVSSIIISPVWKVLSHLVLAFTLFDRKEGRKVVIS